MNVIAHKESTYF